MAVFDQAIAAVQNGQAIGGAPTQPHKMNRCNRPWLPPAAFTEDYAFAIGEEDAPITIVEVYRLPVPYSAPNTAPRHSHK
ncbi:MAG: hypothetical protein IPL78_25940 [Chloroflexi bacterium]|nr:hypothetical protein [Chloroflexota bacterium]